MSGQGGEHGPVRPAILRWLWIAFAAVLALTVGADFMVEHHPAFGLDGTLGFGAWFGFASCIALVLGSRLLGFFLKRPDDTYDR